MSFFTSIDNCFYHGIWIYLTKVYTFGVYITTFYFVNEDFVAIDIFCFCFMNRTHCCDKVFCNLCNINCLLIRYYFLTWLYKGICLVFDKACSVDELFYFTLDIFNGICWINFIACTAKCFAII